ncbi:hypothetical protein P153DRAFT_211093 [Dothidotthia symphoricarpi CBS 119687]|uniref:Uncharacterized protein n=1 Tax=Dothidotthia symphoricarpi CBS 119687 TaxID=1392245 RepID=A0A6A6AJQ6_9PLEO|nr:uncharacterized protein P153DRAFT_211093 [Dothidotthia symphoricarpi CBS 119687]KAF2131107.1 hypothetical protein P153DRAFT_211093 [Dothidotthia symphoricarpi CBS 119687]
MVLVSSQLRWARERLPNKWSSFPPYTLLPADFWVTLHDRMPSLIHYRCTNIVCGCSTRSLQNQRPPAHTLVPLRTSLHNCNRISSSPNTPIQHCTTTITSLLATQSCRFNSSRTPRMNFVSTVPQWHTPT